MKTFLAVYVGTPASMSKWDDLTEAQKQERQRHGIAAWHKWGSDNAAIIENMGGPLGKTKSVSPNGIADIRNNMTGFTLIKAESHEAAAKLFLNHPHFSIFPGDAVEIMEVMPIPGA